MKILTYFICKSYRIIIFFFSFQVHFHSDYSEKKIKKILKFIKETKYKIVNIRSIVYESNNIEEQENNFNNFIKLLKKYKIQKNIILQ